MAIIVRNLHFNYEKYAETCVLNKVNVRVEKGCIYGLLGASGSGKTTLLKNIIGLCKPDFGEVLVFGFPPGSRESGCPGSGVGYMPQELSIQTDLTLNEVFKYFARIHCMEKYQLKGIIQFLLKTLDLPEKHRLIGTLSGGQKRRVSLALALLHKPRLLILDEPTVGVDPILSEVIWKLMFTLSRTHQTTIIITTHYIEEAKRANTVAFMRNGQILQEGNPKELMVKYCAKTLEEIFLQFCTKQEESKCNSSDVVNSSSNKALCTKEVHLNAESNEVKRFFNILIAVILKFITETRRNPFAMAMLFAMTVFTMICVMFVVGETPRNVAVAWVVDEPFFESRTIESISYLNASPEAETIDNSHSTEYLYLPNLLKTTIESDIIDLIYYSNLKNAQKAAKRRLVHGIIHLGANFSKAFFDCDLLLSFGEQCQDNERIKEAIITLYVDLTNPVVANTIRFSLQDSIVRFRRKIATLLALDEQLANPPVIIDPIYGEFSDDDLFGVKAFIAPGFMIFITYGFSVTLASLSLLSEPNTDMFVRTFASGVKPVQTVLGKVIALFLFLSVSSYVNFFGTSYTLNIPYKGSVVIIVSLLSFQTLLGIVHGILFSSLFNNSITSLFTCVGFLYNMLFTSGIMWTVYAQPYFMKWINNFLPLYHAANALRELMNKNHVHVLDAIIWPAFATTFLWTIVLFMLSVYALKRRKN